MSEADAHGSQPFVLLTCRPAESDFRLPLAQEMQALGHPTVYIHLKRQSVVTDMATGETRSLSLAQLLRFSWSLRGRTPRPVIFNSTNLAFPLLSVGLRWISGCRCCLDMHDDLLYDIGGARRVRLALLQKLLIANSDAIVHAAPTLRNLFPRSQHIGNASALLPQGKTRSDPSQVLVLASLDGRFDFDLMARAARAAPDRQFDIYGRISRDDPVIAAALDELVSQVRNVRYQGAYTDRELPSLLSRYLVAFAPYRANSHLTRYIDPLRFYHCLASRTGLVSTAIPQARAVANRIVVLEEAEQIGEALDHACRIRSVGPLRTWATVARTLEGILWPQPGTSAAERLRTMSPAQPMNAR